MSETKHSPAPWEYNPDDHQVIPIWDNGAGHLICHVYQEKNVPVIAAAPELLALLKKFLRFENWESAPECREARELIKKIEQ